MQTQIDNNSGVSNLILTETPICPRQKLQGKKTDDQLWDEMAKEYEAKLIKDHPYHLEFLTLPELKEYVVLGYYLDNHPNYSYEKYQKELRYMALVDKLDYAYIIMKTEEDYQKRRHQKILEKRERKSNNRYELGAREFTFTYSPKWFDDTEARLKMSTAIQKLCKYYKDEIIQLRAVGEVGTNGLSHVHCFYKLRKGTKISDKNFRRAYPPWDTKIKQGPTGHKGGHHATVRNESDFQGYIDKDVESAWFEVNVDNTQDPQN